MRMRLWAACATIALGVSVGVLAQDQTSAASKSMSDKTITVTGCVERAQQSQSPTGTSGSTTDTAGGASSGFILTNTAISPDATAGTSGSATTSASAAPQYRLDYDDAKLTPHVGHKVEVTGTVAENAAPSESSAAGSAASAPKLHVEKVKMLASTCPSSR
jgi:hypothetical protein